MTHIKTLLARTALATVLVASTAAAVQAEMVLRRGNGAEPETLDPHLSTGVPESFIQKDLFEGLVASSPTAESVPGVAESWDVSDDGLTYTFHLREDAVWSDGSPVTAQDFVYSWKRLVNPEVASDYAYFLWPVKNAEAISKGEMALDEMGVEATDDRTFVVTLENQTPYFIDSLQHHSTWVVPQKVVEEHGNEWTRPENIVTNGAFTLAEWVPQSHVKLVKNEQFHDAENVALDTVFFYNTEDVEQELKRFRAGELDVTYDAPSQQIPWIEENLPEQFHNTTYLGTYFYGFNTTVEPFDDPKLREALSMAIDRDILTKQITQGGEVPAYGWVPPGLEGYESQSLEWGGLTQEQRNAEAMKLFTEAGYGPDNPLDIEILYNTSDNHKKIAIAIAAMWKQNLDGAVNATLRNEEWKVYLESRDQLQFQAVRAGWIGDYKDPYTFASYLRGDIGVQNPAGYDSEEYNTLMQQSVTEADPAKRMDIMEEAERVLLEDLPIMPIYFYTTQHLVADNVEGWEDNIMDYHLSRYITVQQ